MKRIKCEICESFDIQKLSNNIFKCKSCGCQYTQEQAKELLQEVADSEINDETLVNDNATVKNLLIRARQSKELGQIEEYNNFLDRVLEMEPKNHEAWWEKYLIGIESDKDDSHFDELRKAVQETAHYGDEYNIRLMIEGMKNKGIEDISSEKARDLYYAIKLNATDIYQKISDFTVKCAENAIEYAEVASKDYYQEKYNEDILYFENLCSTAREKIDKFRSEKEEKEDTENTTQEEYHRKRDVKKGMGCALVFIIPILILIFLISSCSSMF